MTHITSCPSCNAEFEVEIDPYIPARDWGHPDLQTPASGGTVEPSSCPTCKFALDTNRIYEEWAEL